MRVFACLIGMVCCLQYECSSRNVEILQNTTDARGRKFEVIKVPCPPPMFRTHKEADTVDVSRMLALRRVYWNQYPSLLLPSHRTYIAVSVMVVVTHLAVFAIYFEQCSI